jgi:tRNA modification GTPase
MPFGETIVACATPPGESAIALIRLSGPAAAAIAQEAFNLSRPLRARYATAANYHSLQGNKIDSTLFTFFAAPASYTGEDLLEISTHGNALIVKMIIHDCLNRGARLAEPGEFTKTAFLNGKLDLSQAEAVTDLIHAKTQKGIEIAHRQLEGELTKKVKPLVDQLLTLLAHLQAYIDFPEEDIPEEDVQGSLQQLQSIVDGLKALKASHQRRGWLQNGIQLVLVGAPNAGKSSLLNTLLKEDRALVSPEAGTTRDFITENLNINSFCIQITDTAGIRSSNTLIEQKSIEKTLKKAQHADFFLFVVDQSIAPPTLDENLLQWMNPANTLVINNKLDLPPHLDHNSFLATYPKIAISIKENINLSALQTTLQALIEERFYLSTDESIAVNERHFEALSQALQALTEASTLLKEGFKTELAALELEQSLDCLGAIVGKVDNEAMLDKLFSAFCIGK